MPMKKFLSLLLICVMVISAVFGCGKKSEPLSGKELAKLYGYESVEDAEGRL